MSSLATNPNALPRDGAAKSVSIARQCLVLTLAMVGLWAVLYIPASRLGGARGTEGLTYAALLCLIPGCIALAMTGLMVNVGSHASHGAMMSTVFRLLVVGVAAVMLQSARPDLRFWNFHLWLIVCYVAALAFETIVILKGVHRSPPSSQH